MPKAKKTVKIRDQKPAKDPKGGSWSHKPAYAQAVKAQGRGRNLVYER